MPDTTRAPAHDATEARLDALVAGLTLREKVGQLNQRLLGWQAVERVGGGYRLTDTFHAEVERWGGLGALYGLFRADAWSGRDWETGVLPQDRAEVAVLVADAVRAASSHGIGALVVEEAPHGHQALGGPLLPTNLAVGSAWDPDLFAEAAEAVSALLRADGVHLALVSALDLLRDPRWGRSEECFSEDPDLSAALAAALVEGMQGTDRARVRAGEGVGVVLKHLAGQGEGVGGRNGHSASLGPRDLAALHLRAARAGVDAGALGLMAAYNDIDGIPCLANAGLLTGTLRDDWGFDGLVMADGKAVDRLVEILGEPRAAAAAALSAGVDLSLWDESYTRLEEAADDDPALHGAIDAACRRVLRVKAELGLLGDAVDGGRPAAARDRVDLADRALGLSEALAERSAVLLRRGPLPWAPREGARWVVAGPHADLATSLLGDYVPPLRPDEAVSVAQALEDRLVPDGADVALVPGVPAADDLRGADVVVAVVGGTSHREPDEQFADNGASAGATAADCGEGVDRADLRLPAGQDGFLRRLRGEVDAAGHAGDGGRRPWLVAVVVAGRPYDLSGVLATADAVLLAWYPGPRGGRALARLLVGDAQPVGRLPVTLPAGPGVVPARWNERMTPDGVYRDAPTAALATVGAGSGYADVGLLGWRVAARHGGLVVEVDVLGRAAGGAVAWTGPAEEVVRVVVRRRGSLEWTRLELAAFARVRVRPGERATVVLTVPRDRAFVAEPAPLALVETDLTVVVGTRSERRTVAPAAAPAR
ncbi:glycoside hydrolase family 3 N-terminal domain-containing protein [Isoptericola sp. NPDC057653]|uniref:glycoside hydrolase family 3 N-terminal domain-containing protein n=1 Tax=Isoptericola sp. NPDC057653 TaxID=3346195 RepID=UPI00367824A5